MLGILSAWREWRDRRDILRDYRREAADIRELNHFKFQDERKEALATIHLNDPAKATRIWSAAVAKYPEEVSKSPLAFELLLKLGQ